MSHFCCEICGAVQIDTDQGYMTGCEHYLADIDPTSEILRKIEEISASMKIVDIGRRPRKGAEKMQKRRNPEHLTCTGLWRRL